MNRSMMIIPVMLFAPACHRTLASVPTVHRVSVAPASDLPIRDPSTLVLRALLHDCLSRGWARRFLADTGRRPVVKLRPLENRAAGAINTVAYTKQLEMQLLNSGLVSLAGSPDDDLRFELVDQQRHASAATTKTLRPSRADFILVGWIISLPAGDHHLGDRMTTLQLIDVRTNEKVWIGIRRNADVT